eukprot:CAMPEP_0172483126 /NCGR_PEP_ID=MMETSP1066-20121228/9962_1 /TAXON_ID=671091 /ORGANISM="Coscinodiscus wailesii, Strain CCMP2513" /LENGTH=208 /DNA_ID=CAMNT_0013246807 /DNA_START=70 /DNA_END=696 /DNA_ORIENTATION=+
MTAAKAQFKIDRRFHRWLESCATGNTPKPDQLCNDKVFKAIEDKMFFKYVKLPAGMKPDQEKPPSFQPSCKKRDAKQHYQYTPFQSQEQGAPVVNPSVDNECKLGYCDIFKSVFHCSDTQDLDMRMDNGEEMCIAFHSKGKCFSTCKRALSHFTLSKNKKMKCRMIVGSCRDKQKAFCDNPKKGRFSLPPQTTYQKQNQQQGNQWQQN